MSTETSQPRWAPWKRRVHEVIFEADTRAGKLFDVGLLIAILLSVVIVMLETVRPLREQHGELLVSLEWVFTGLFTVEYLLRLLCVRKSWRYATSFFGVVDLLAVLPSYLGLVLGADVRALLVIRALRLLRVFRIFKLGRLVREAEIFKQAILRSWAKIAVFLTAVLVVVVLTGAAMYLVENGGANPDSDFSSLPTSCYWAVVTMTTVGYGDIAPETAVGKMLAAMIMILGYSFIIVPTGIFAAALARGPEKPISTQSCPNCLHESHDADAHYCKRCGGKL